MREQSEGDGAVLRGWGATVSSNDPGLVKLESQLTEARNELHATREKGRKLRVNRLESVNALETRLVTLTAILNRMEKELMDEDVYTYGDILAEVFGERKIYEQRAIGMEATLCQLMHQMLFRQHQLKIMKKSAKDVQSRYKKYKQQNKDEYHSYDTLAVKLEASRLTLEAQYDDIFAAQHSLLAQLKHVEAFGTMTNYSIPMVGKTPEKKKPILQASIKHINTPPLEESKTPAAFRDYGENDYEAAMDILATSPVLDMVKRNLFEAETKRLPHKLDVMREERLTQERRQSARGRRREIERLRKAQVLGNSKGIPSPPDEDGPRSPRDRMRELEAIRQRMSETLGSTQDGTKTSPEKRAIEDERRKHREELKEQFQFKTDSLMT